MLYDREPSLLCLVASTNSIVLKALRKTHRRYNGTTLVHQLPA